VQLVFEKSRFGPIFDGLGRELTLEFGTFDVTLGFNLDDFAGRHAYILAQLKDGGRSGI
jgi:hypothetical protein